MPKTSRTADVARRLVDAYVTSLRQHLPTYCIRQLDKLPGAHEHQLTRLRQSYPGAPTELLYFLQRVNGTCWESLVTPPGSAAASSTTSASASTNTAAAAEASSAPATPPASKAVDEPSSSSEKATPKASAAPATPKASAKATAAAATIASEAAAFIKSQLAKKVGGASTKPRRLPHYVALPILGSTYTGCPYYLKSVDQMLLAEQQFPPPSANLPDEGECWAPPPPQQQSQQQQSTSSSPSSPSGGAAPSNASGNNSADSTSSATGAKDASLSNVAAAAASAQLNQNTIASVYAGYKIVYGAPPALEGKAAAATAAAAEAATITQGNFDFSSADSSKDDGEAKVVFVDPRIDVNANFYHWLVFADSVQPHVRGSAPTIPDADPAKVAAAEKNGGVGASPPPISKPRPSSTTTADPPKFFAASRLYIDFKPVELQGGVYGQVIQFVHGQPDSFTVVANDFGSYLKYIMSEEYDFTEELEDDEDDEEDEEENLIATAAQGSGKSSGPTSSSSTGPATSSSSK